MITALERLEIQKTYLNIIKEIHSKPTVDSNLNKENNNTFPLTSATRQACPPSAVVQIRPATIETIVAIP